LWYKLSGKVIFQCKYPTALKMNSPNSGEI
jgi:hypothetical protein